MLLSLMTTCDPTDTSKVSFANKSNRDVYVQVVDADEEQLRCSSRTSPYLYMDGGVAAGITRVFETGWGTGNLWLDFVREQGYLTVLVVDKATYMEYKDGSCDFIHQNVPILHRYQLTLEELDRTGWTIVYPPESGK